MVVVWKNKRDAGGRGRRVIVGVAVGVGLVSSVVDILLFVTFSAMDNLKEGRTNGQIWSLLPSFA